jgi:hypothetical protein
MKGGVFRGMMAAAMSIFGSQLPTNGPVTRNYETPGLFKQHPRAGSHWQPHRGGDKPSAAKLAKRRYAHGPGSIGEYDMLMRNFLNGTGERPDRFVAVT